MTHSINLNILPPFNEVSSLYLSRRLKAGKKTNSLKRVAINRSLSEVNPQYSTTHSRRLRQCRDLRRVSPKWLIQHKESTFRASIGESLPLITTTISKWQRSKRILSPRRRTPLSTCQSKPNETSTDFCKPPTFIRTYSAKMRDKTTLRIYLRTIDTILSHHNYSFIIITLF